MANQTGQISSPNICMSPLLNAAATSARRFTAGSSSNPAMPAPPSRASPISNVTSQISGIVQGFATNGPMIDTTTPPRTAIANNEERGSAEGRGGDKWSGGGKPRGEAE